jgi:hypothetical protein
LLGTLLRTSRTEEEEPVSRNRGPLYSLGYLLGIALVALMMVLLILLVLQLG